jgi:hypothetical protein
MTPIPDPIQDAENILRQESERLGAQQSEEHQRTQPFLHTEARRLVTIGNRNHLYCHLFIITEQELPEGERAANPLNIPTSEAVTAGFQLTHSFQTHESALKAMRDPRTQIVINELRKNNECALYLYTQDGLAIMVAGTKLTVTQRDKNRQFVINHTALDAEKPQDFLDRCGTNDDENELITALVGLLHAGGIMEDKSPNQYHLVLKRLHDQNELDDFFGEQDDQ